MSKSRNKTVEKSRRSAAAMAHQTAGRSRNLTPNDKAYDRNDTGWRADIAELIQDEIKADFDAPLGWNEEVQRTIDDGWGDW